MELNQQLETVNAFVREELFPLEPAFLREGFTAIEPALQTARQKVKALGLWAPPLPAEYGGLGLELQAFARLSEALGRSPFGHYVFNCAAPDIGNMEVLLAHGTPAQKERWLKPLAAGRLRSCFGMTEPEHAGSNPVWLSATAVPDGADYVINGHKWFATAADGAAFAIVMAVTDPHAAKLHQRASQIIVPLDTPGVTVSAIPIMGEAGAGWLSHGELRFENCRVPQTNRLGAEGAGFALAQERLGPGRIHHCMRWIGIAERAFDLLCRHAATRELAPGRPLAQQQIVQHWIADSRAEINASRLLVLDAAARIDAVGTRAARVEISTIKFFVANMLQRVLDRAIQTHGALGITDYTVLSFWYRHERAARIYDGPDEVHRAVVARAELKKYGVDIQILG
ncbi:MAG: acyl-CoA dehydrogenase family protein [Anaerolineales bacterium]|nr:acyl-CoA dehydrogenase family protein [Anaerolineales bacterium]